MNERYWGYCLDEILVLDGDFNLAHIDSSTLESASILYVMNADDPEYLCKVIAEDKSEYKRASEVKDAMLAFESVVAAYRLSVGDRTISRTS